MIPPYLWGLRWSGGRLHGAHPRHAHGSAILAFISHQPPHEQQRRFTIQNPRNQVQKPANYHHINFTLLLKPNFPGQLTWQFRLQVIPIGALEAHTIAVSETTNYQYATVWSSS